MHQGAGGGIQFTQDRQGDGQEVDAHGKSNAELDGLDGSIGQPLEVGQLGYIVTHENDIGSVHSDITAQTSHGNAHSGGFQSRRIVDTVADHADSFSLILDCCNIADLFFRQQLRSDLSDTNLPGKVVSSFLIITGQQNDIRVHTM